MLKEFTTSNVQIFGTPPSLDEVEASPTRCPDPETAKNHGRADFRNEKIG